MSESRREDMAADVSSAEVVPTEECTQVTSGTPSGIQSVPILPSLVIHWQSSDFSPDIAMKCSSIASILGPERSSAPCDLAYSAWPSEPFRPRRPPRPASGLTSKPSRGMCEPRGVWSYRFGFECGKSALWADEGIDAFKRECVSG